jgi:hypothetical protein
MISDESQIKAACIMRDAAEQMSRAADQMEFAAHRIGVLFEDGHGGNGLRLIGVLEKLLERHGSTMGEILGEQLRPEHKKQT